jgi:hypothetical protein
VPDGAPGPYSDLIVSQAREQCLLDLVTIAVLVSGLYLWLWRRSPVEARLAELESLAT